MTGSQNFTLTPGKTVGGSLKRRQLLSKSSMKTNNYGHDDEMRGMGMSSPSQGTFNKRANSQMGNVAPRRRIMGGANVYATPTKNGLRNSMQAP